MKVVNLDDENEEIWLDIYEIVSENDSLEKGINYLYQGLEKQPLNYLIYARLVASLLKIGKENEAAQNLLVILTNNDQENTILIINELTLYYPNLLKHNNIIELIDNFNNL